MGFEIHHGGNPLNNVANLHIAMAIRNTTWFEVLVQSSAMNTASSGRACCTLRRNPGSGTRSTWSWSHGSGSIAVLELPRTPIGAAARRVGGDVAAPTPHRPGRADFPHPVPR